MNYQKGDKVHIGSGKATWVVQGVYASGNAWLTRDDREVFISTPPNQINRHGVKTTRLRRADAATTK